MDRIAGLPASQLRELFNETAAKMNTVPVIIEKDFWVVWVLDKLFSHETLCQVLLFKGGTSLSKVYDVIGRFSEDIDLVLDWGKVTSDAPEKPRDSRTQQDKFNKAMNVLAQEYIRGELLPIIQGVLSPHCECSVDEHNPHIINVRYPALHNAGYLRPEILLEIGPLASWTPSAEFEISSYAAQQFPALFARGSCKVSTILAKRTFWEKATILHQEAHRPADKVMPSRYSRHYYDLALMSMSDIKNEALADLDLLQKVVDFKVQFYPSGFARYDTARVGSLLLVPADARLAELRQDYDKMQEMIFDKHLDFDIIIHRLFELEKEINSFEMGIE